MGFELVSKSEIFHQKLTAREQVIDRLARRVLPLLPAGALRTRARGQPPSTLLVDDLIDISEFLMENVTFGC